MIGFFEHQFLSFKKNHLRNLIALAKADGHLHPDEEKMIYKVGDKYGLKDRQIASLLRSDKKLELHVPDTHDEKMDQLYDIVMMVYADGVVEESEIEFCEDIVDKFGYKKEIVKWLIEFFDEGKEPNKAEWAELKETAGKKFI
ncbi:MAG: TerB family tellurite resistance protein [Fulvivirga sp.]|uniref:tellurite resistance TerB family protein n=1 Tax=Fulvivirga sp. TaxID=1931237 RepID=UPI0032EB0462